MHSDIAIVGGGIVGLATALNLLQRFRDGVFRFRFYMNRDRVRASFDESRNVMIGVLNHKMDIEWKTC